MTVRHAQLILALCTGVFAQNQSFLYLTGEQSGTIAEGTYVVTGTVYVLKGQTLRIAPGTRLYFEQYTGITVLGSLFCEGTLNEPIVLTSKKEAPDQISAASPDPFDWNGIEATPEALTISVSNTKIRNCVFGINIKSERSRILIERVEFYNNGNASLARAGKIIEVQPGSPFGITWNVDENAPVERIGISNSDKGNTPANTATSNKPDRVKKKHTGGDRGEHVTLKWSLGIGGGAAALAGAGMFIGGAVNANHNWDMYIKEQDPDRVQFYRSKYNSAIQTQRIGAVLFGAGLCSVTFSIIIKK